MEEGGVHLVHGVDVGEEELLLGLALQRERGRNWPLESCECDRGGEFGHLDSHCVAFASLYFA